jgi:hypothetical protein
MYTRTKEYVRSNATDADRFIENIKSISDYANSTLLKYLDECDTLLDYTITKYECRVDLISKDIYKSDRYSWILMYINRMSIEDFIRGRVIKYIPIKYIEQIYDRI